MLLVVKRSLSHTVSWVNRPCDAVHTAYRGMGPMLWSDQAM